ncbi:calcium-binding protein [Methylobacterium sp. Leaf118]|uniref:calcium-binding protein n=1 Tax=Methylobacterium sp. Leaf118 TaxID=2876562 RepID=UPI001E5F6079|nr:calcium-binding protein [Methylobacterium sp. Leaf118]
MATFRLTVDDEIRNGTGTGDLFDGYDSDDGFGFTGGNDTLRGLGGNDTFLLNVSTAVTRGLIDGGADTDTVVAYGFDLGQLNFQNVEILSIESGEFGASIAQLAAFSTITSARPSLSQINITLTGDGGTIDFAERMAPGKAIRVVAQGLNSGYDIVGTGLNDAFFNSRYDDTVRGGGGADTFFAVNRQYAGSSGPEPGGTDTLFGDAGADSFYLRAQAGTFDGGSGNDTVYAFQFNENFVSPLGDLGTATFLNMERLVAGNRVTYVQLAQLNAFATITGGDANKLIWFDLSGAAGGTIDFSTKLKLSGEHVWIRAYNATSAVTLTGTAGNDTLEGSAFEDTLRGGDGNDYLGGAGFSFGPQSADRLIGGAGDDTYFVDVTDTLIETETGASGGIDTVISTGTFDLVAGPRLQGEFEHLTLSGYLGAENPHSSGYGNALDNVITGNGGNNRLDGRAGADTLIGGGGNDIYVLDNAGDRVVERVGYDAGIDRILASVSVDLGDAGQVTGFIETVTLQGSAAIDATGDDRDNTLIGNAGANILDGRGGRDTLRGGGGDDTYYADQAGDFAYETAGAGLDTVYASVSYGVGQQSIETLVLTGSAAIGGTGGAGANTIIGNDAANRLDGAGGSDILVGLGGNDTYFVDTMADTVLEGSGGGGNDTVWASVNYTLRAGQEIETLRAAKGMVGLVLTGNERANAIQGADGADRLTGGGGKDTLTGAGGADAFVFGSLAESGPGVARDIITDFVAGQDRIDLSMIDANTTAGAVGNQAFTWVTGAFSNTAGELHQVALGADTLVEGDVDGNGAADFQILLRGPQTLQETDFVL